jgi:hypothetical protein
LIDFIEVLIFPKDDWDSGINEFWKNGFQFTGGLSSVWNEDKSLQRSKSISSEIEIEIIEFPYFWTWLSNASQQFYESIGVLKTM